MRAILLATLLCVVALSATAQEPQIDADTGLVIAPGWEIVKGQCNICHSTQTILANRATRKGWLDVIRWMQATQGLWNLGTSEAMVLDYLASNYGVPENYRSMRRAPLSKDKLP